MAQFLNMFAADLKTGPAIVQLRQMFFGDDKANRIGAIVTDGGEDVALSGAVVGTVIVGGVNLPPIAGTISGNQAYIDLPDTAYAYPGPIQVFVTLNQEAQKTTLVAGFGNVQLTDTGAVIDPGTIIPSVAALIEEIQDAIDNIPPDYSALTLAVRDNYHPVLLGSSLFVQGGIANGTGADYSSNYYIRTGYMAAIPEGVLYIINKSAAYRYNIHQYAADKTWISALAIEDQSAEKAFQLAPTAYYVRFVLKFANNNAITPADADNAKVFVDWARRAVLVSQSAAQAISGGTIEVNSWVQAYGTYRYPYPVRKGIEYTYTNLSGASTNLWLYDSAGNQLIRITGGVLANASITFKAPMDADAIGGYFNSSSFHFTIAVAEGLAEKVNNLGNTETNHLALNAQHIPGSNSGALTILHFSDIHADTVALARIMADAAKISGVTDAICTGDMTANVGGEIASWWPEDVLTVIGNHDTATQSGSTYDWTAVSVADRIAYYISPFESNWGITRPSGKSYYYKDYADHGVRLIVMDVMLYTAGGADATAQTTWLSGLLSDAIANDLHVIIAIHAPHVSSAVDCNFSKYGQGVWSGDASCNTPQGVIDAVASAITGGLKFIGYICGHTHQDNVWDAAGDGTQLMYGITCAATTSRAQWTNSDQDRTGEQDAFNLITIDPARTLIKIIRGGGANVDDHLRSRKTLCIDYSTNTIISEN